MRCHRINCRAVLRDETDAIGRLTLVCEPCERNRAGLCRDCPAPLEKPKALRCPTCAYRRNLERVRTQSAHYYREHRTRVLARQRSYQARPEVAEKLRGYKRDWAARNRDDAHRLVQREYQRQRRARLRGTPC